MSELHIPLSHSTACPLHSGAAPSNQAVPENAQCADVDSAVDFALNPYPYYEKWRTLAPVIWSNSFFQGGWLVTRHAEVESVLKDPRFSTERTAGWIRNIDAKSPRSRAEMDMLQNLLASALLFMDGPEHAQLRKVLMAAFMPAQLKLRLPAIVQLVNAQIAHIGHHYQGQAFDYVQEFARCIPSRMTCMLMGIPQEDSPLFMDLSETLVRFISAIQPTAQQAQAANKSLRTMRSTFKKLLKERRQLRAAQTQTPAADATAAHAPQQTDLIDHLLDAEQQGLLRTDVQMLAQCAMLLVAGHDTTRNLLGNGMHALLSQPAQWRLLAEQPQLAPQAVRELLRIDSPVQYTARRATVGMELAGQSIARGQLVVALIASANRDPLRHNNPDVLDITRSSASHLAFGRGSHFCIGAGLAQMLAEVALPQLAQQWPTLCMAAKPQWNGNAALRGLQSLMVATQPV